MCLNVEVLLIDIPTKILQLQFCSCKLHWQKYSARKAVLFVIVNCANKMGVQCMNIIWPCFALHVADASHALSYSTNGKRCVLPPHSGYLHLISSHQFGMCTLALYYADYYKQLEMI